MAQSLAWGADLLLSPHIALATALWVASASMEGAGLPLPAPRQWGQRDRWAGPAPAEQPRALGWAAGQ